MSAVFDGTNKLIILGAGTTDLVVKPDIYSAWKDWAAQGDNSKYLPAISAIGGDTISDTMSLGTTYFLENGWKIRPFEGNHFLTISGNLFTRDGSSPFVSTIGNYNVTINMARSNLIDTVVTSGGSGGSSDTSAIASAVWNKQISQISTPNSIGELIKELDNKADTIAAITAAGL